MDEYLHGIMCLGPSSRWEVKQQNHDASLHQHQTRIGRDCLTLKISKNDKIVILLKLDSVGDFQNATYIHLNTSATRCWTRIR